MKELLLPFLRASRSSRVVWAQHCCYSAPIVASMQRILEGENLSEGERICIFPDRPARAPLKALYLAPYNDNIAFSPMSAPSWTDPTPAGQFEFRIN